MAIDQTSLDVRANMATGECPVCRYGRAELFPVSTRDATEVACLGCGTYRITREAIADLPGYLRKDESHWRILLAHHIRKLQRANESPVIFGRTIEEIISVQHLPSLPEQIDNLIVWLGENSPLNEIHRIDYVSFRAIVGANEHGIDLVRDELYDAGLVRLFGNSDNIQLRLKGWHRFEEIKKGIGVARKAFMAMQYGDAKLDEIVNRHFLPAVEQTGFHLSRLDTTPRAGLIDDHLRVEIRTARFLVADLSHANNGAYWEAGYAEGLGKPVIYTCDRSVFDNAGCRPHFDTNHHQTVLWDPANLGEACRRLKDTIRATLPGEAKMVDD